MTEYLEEKEVNLVASKEELESLQRLRGSRCIKHFDDLRDDYFFGGFDKDNKNVLLWERPGLYNVSFQR